MANSDFEDIKLLARSPSFVRSCLKADTPSSIDRKSSWTDEPLFATYFISLCSLASVSVNSGLDSID